MWAATAAAQPVYAPVATPAAGTDRYVASAGVGGLWAVSDGVSAVVRDARGADRLTRSVADFASVIPGLDAGTARIGQICLSESGRLLFITVQRPARTDTLTSRTDEIVRIEVETGAASRFATIVLNGVANASAQSSPLVHAGGRLYAAGASGVIGYNSFRNDVTATSATTIGPFSPGVSAMAYDRAGPSLFILLRDNRLLRHNLVSGQSVQLLPPSASPTVTSMAFCDHHGGGGTGGLFFGQADGRVRLLSTAAAREAGGTPSDYASVGTVTPAMTRVAAGFDGSLLVGRSGETVGITDASDTRLTFENWMVDELAQQVRFAKSLISPSGEPAGWVIDGNVVPGGTLFHPATPDAAAWAVLLLLAGDDVLGDTEARPLVRLILKRYAGQLPGPAPSRTADGIYRHWIDPATGGVKPGWDPEFAVMSTMKLVAAAARAGNFYAGDAEIVIAARAICCGVGNHDAYLTGQNHSLYLKGLAGGGPDPNSALQPFHEGIMFVEQAAFYGSSSTDSFDAWLDRSWLPFAQIITDRSITSNWFGFQPAFVSIYPMLLTERYRNDPAWQEQVASVSASAAAWTDDNLLRWFTVFSAGTSKPEWGGYHADRFFDAPGSVSTLTALMGLAARADAGGVREAGAAYHAYRAGARQAFRGGSSILYRRSSLDPAWTPPDGGLPDIAMGGLGLAELLRPGFAGRVLLSGYPVCSACAADVGRAGGTYGPDGVLNNNDFVVFIDAFFGGNRLVADVGSQGGVAGGDGMLDNNDFIVFIDAFFGGC